MDYGMNSVSQGIDALAITRVVIRPVGQIKPGVTPQVMQLHAADAAAGHMLFVVFAPPVLRCMYTSTCA